MLRTTIGSLLSILLLASCQKSDSPQLDLTPPVINIVSPDSEQLFAPGDSLNFHVEITENQALHDYSVVLRNEDRSVAETITLGHSHDTHLVFKTAIILPNLQNQRYTLTVKASDHNDNLASERVYVNVY